MAAVTRPLSTTRPGSGPRGDARETKSSYVPGFGGHCPQVKFSTGETYGNATRNFFRFTRLESLNTSTMPHSRRNSVGGEGTIHSLAPVVTPRSRPGSGIGEMWSCSLPYALTHTGARRDEIMSFEKSAQKHRAHYKDHTGTAPRMYEFSHRRGYSAPALIMPQQKDSNEGDSLSLAGAKTFLHPSSSTAASTASSRNTWLKWSNTGRKTSSREREVRDQFFERR